MSIEPIRRLAAQATDHLPDAVAATPRGPILRVALRLFAERGYAGTSIRDIAAMVGLRSATLYSHFPSKEHVLAEIARIGHEEHLRRVRAALLDCQPDPREQVKAYVLAHVGLHADCPMLAVVANSEMHMLSPALGAETFALRRQSEELLVDIVQRGVDRGVFKVAHVWLATAAIGGMGLRVAFWYTPEFALDAGAIGSVYADYALRILGAGEPAGRTRRPRPRGK